MIKITGARSVIFWGSLCATLFILCYIGHENFVDLSAWGLTVFIIWLAALLTYLANRRSPVHRGSFAHPVSSSTSLILAISLGLAALAGVYGLWFGVLVPVPIVIAAYGVVRDRKLRQRMIDAGAVDPKAPPYLARAGRPREIPSWPEPSSDGTG